MENGRPQELKWTKNCLTLSTQLYYFAILVSDSWLSANFYKRNSTKMVDSLTYEDKAPRAELRLEGWRRGEGLHPHQALRSLAGGASQQCLHLTGTDREKFKRRQSPRAGDQRTTKSSEACGRAREKKGQRDEEPKSWRARELKSQGVEKPETWRARELELKN